MINSPYYSIQNPFYNDQNSLKSFNKKNFPSNIGCVGIGDLPTGISYTINNESRQPTASMINTFDLNFCIFQTQQNTEFMLKKISQLEESNNELNNTISKFIKGSPVPMSFCLRDDPSVYNANSRRKEVFLLN